MPIETPAVLSSGHLTEGRVLPQGARIPSTLGDFRDSRLALVVRTNIKLLVEPLARPALALRCDRAQLSVVGNHTGMLQEGDGIAPVALRTPWIMTIENVIDRRSGREHVQQQPTC